MEQKLSEGKFAKINVLAIVTGTISVITLMYSLWWASRWFDGPISSAIWHGYFNPFFFVGLPMFIVAVISHLWMSNCVLTVTNKRVYGKAAFGKRVDLPLDMISSVSSAAFGSVSVATSSGKITFWLLKNKEEVFSSVTKLLLDRQNNKDVGKVEVSASKELKDLKQLLDEEIITKEEFEAKKKELLKL